MLRTGWSVQWNKKNGKKESLETESRHEADMKAAEMRDKGMSNVVIYQCIF